MRIFSIKYGKASWKVFIYKGQQVENIKAMLRYILLTPIVIKYICTKAPKSWMLFCSHPRLDPSAPFQPNPFCLLMKPLHPTPLISLSCTEGAGHSKQASPTSHNVSWPQQQRLLKIRWETVDSNPYLAALGMWNVNLYCIHTTPLTKWLFPHINLEASWFCALAKSLHFWISGVACEWTNPHQNC